MIRFERTDSSNAQFLDLVKLLDADLAISDGDEHDFYHQYNGLDNIKHVILAYYDDLPIGCGAIKYYDDSTAEVKRMYILPAYRGRQYALHLLKELEAWANALGYTSCILETGKKQPAAIRLYTKAQYHITENYGQYAGVDNSICFRKDL